MFVTLDRMHPADDQLVYSQVRAEGDRYLYRIKQAGTQTIKLATSEDNGGACKVTLQADYFDTETKEISQVGREFRSLNITNNRIAQGLGRSVNITFQLASEEGNNAQKDVTVELLNMTIGGKHTVTFNTGDSNFVTNNNGTFTIKNVVTADDPAGELKVTLTAKGYSSSEATFTDRPRANFNALTFSQNGTTVTSLPSSTSSNVDFSFELSDYEEGMEIPVTVELQGLEPADGTLTRSTEYTYVVTTAGTQTIKLKTQTGLSECWVKLSAPEEYYFDASAQETITMVSKITIPAKTINLQCNNNFNNTSSKNKLEIFTVNPKQNTSAISIGSSTCTRNGTSSADKKKAKNDSAIELDGVTNTTTVYIKCSIDSTVYYSGEVTVQDLLDGASIQIA